MAHRGRISILHNFLGKSLKSICNDFSEVDEQYGDVKYHLGTRAVVNVTYTPSAVDEYGGVGSFNSGGGSHDDNMIVTSSDSFGYLRNGIKMNSPNDEMIESSGTTDSRDSNVITTTTTPDSSSGRDSSDNSREKNDFDGGTTTIKMKTVKVNLAANPSHLEAVNAVVLGRCELM